MFFIYFLTLFSDILLWICDLLNSRSDSKYKNGSSQVLVSFYESVFHFKNRKNTTIHFSEYYKKKNQNQLETWNTNFVEQRNTENLETSLAYASADSA